MFAKLLIMSKILRTELTADHPDYNAEHTYHSRIQASAADFVVGGIAAVIGLVSGHGVEIISGSFLAGAGLLVAGKEVAVRIDARTIRAQSLGAVSLNNTN